MSIVIDLQDKDSIGLQIKESISALKAIITEEYAKNNPELLDNILNSAALVTLNDSMHELIKNSIDAKATKLIIRFIITADEKVSFEAIDNGTGFPEHKLGPYPISAEEIGISDKAADKTQAGGNQKGLLQASIVLHRNNGHLIRKNTLSDAGMVVGAKLVFSSPIKKCAFTICDYQTEHDTRGKEAQIAAAIQSIQMPLGSAASLTRCGTF